MKKNKFKFLIIAISILNFSCSLPHNSTINPLFPISGCESPTKNPTMSIDKLMSYPEFSYPKSAEINSNSFSTLINMLTDSKNPTKSCAYYELNLSINNVKFKDVKDFKIEKVWFINVGLNEVWEKNKYDFKQDGTLIFYGGPQWGSPDSHAIIKITDSNNYEYFIRSKVNSGYTAV